MASRKFQSGAYVARIIFLFDGAAVESQATGRTKVTSVQLCTVNCRPMFRDSLVYLISSFIVGKLIGPSVNAAPITPLHRDK